MLFDFVDTTKGSVHWCHKAYVWASMFAKDTLSDLSEQVFNTFHHEVRACKQRSKKGGDNLAKTIEVGRKSKPYRLEVASLYRPIPVGLSKDELKTLVVDNLLRFTTDAQIQNCYYSLLAIKTSSTAMLREVKPLSREGSDVNPDAQYWNRMKGALIKERVVVHELQHLSNVFLDTDIETIVTTALPNISRDMLKNPRFLTPEVFKFIGKGFGNAN